jgi:hypothetical protein
MAENVFYLAEAHIVEVKNANEYKIWLLDHKNDTWIDDYLDGKHPIPLGECIDLDLRLMLGNPGSSVHYLESYGKWNDSNDDRLTKLAWGVPISDLVRGRIAIHEDLWNRVPSDRQPLPPYHRHQPYRLQIVTRTNGASIEAFFGYHVKVLDTDASRSHILFRSWADDVLGDDWYDLSGPEFETTYSTITASSKTGDEGALFVSMDSIKEDPFPFLDLAKVPFGGRTGRSYKRLTKAFGGKTSNPSNRQP